jgi:transposase, IS5 family
MKPREALDEGQGDMFRSRLDQIIDMGHPKAVLARQIDWRHLAGRFGECYSLEPGHPALPTRLMAGCKSSNIPRTCPTRFCATAGSRTRSAGKGSTGPFSDPPHYQYFCGEEFFQHELTPKDSLVTARQ